MREGKKMYIYECDSVVCKGESYIVTQKPLVCPYCDTSALYEEPKYKVVRLDFDEVDKKTKK